MLTHPTYQRGSLPRPFLPYGWENSSWGRFRTYMHSALILTELRYTAVPLE